MTLFRLDASIRVDRSASREIADVVEQEWLDAHPGDRIVRRHIGTDALPADAWAAAVSGMMTPPEQRSLAQRSAAALAATLADELIQADAEAQLRSNGLRVRGEGVMPALYFQVSVLCDDRDPCAIDVSSAAVQDVYLEALATTPIRAKTWYTGQIILAARSEVSETVRNAVRGQADEFAADVAAVCSEPDAE